MNIMKITDQKQLNLIYEMRYKVFFEPEKDAPKSLYPDGLVKTEVDDQAIHLGCFEGETLLGFLSIVLKATTGHLPIEKQFGIVSEENSAEIMFLLIIDENIKGKAPSKKGEILKSLLVATSKILESNNTSFIYLISIKSSQRIYEKIGFSKIGDYELYENFSWQCPMKLDPNDVRLI